MLMIRRILRPCEGLPPPSEDVFEIVEDLGHEVVSAAVVVDTGLD
jgi:hypothetical protein